MSLFLHYVLTFFMPSPYMLRMFSVCPFDHKYLDEQQHAEIE